LSCPSFFTFPNVLKVTRLQDVAGKGKDAVKDDAGLKRTRSSSLAAATGPQRVPLGPGRTESVAQRPTSRTSRASVFKRASRQEPAVPVVIPTEEEKENDMDVEDIEEDPELSIINEKEVDEMVGVQEQVTPEQEEKSAIAIAKSPRIWPDVDTERAVRHYREIAEIQETFEDEVDYLDTTMVSEYSEEIFKYMNDLEVRLVCLPFFGCANQDFQDDVMPNPDYMDGQNEITWAMRQTLVDWLLQVHLRWHMLPETLWIAINIVDRFLTRRVVSLVKLQLVGVTAMFIAAKYEEILAPSVDEFVFITENGYTKEEILKGERIVLQTLDFKVSQYCSPYSWMRRISKADNYDIQTRTLGKFLTEVTLLDHRFLRCKPSLIAAVGMYSARRMLGGDWVSTASSVGFCVMGTMQTRGYDGCESCD